ncbi:hypothetical protein K1X76_10665 [bacterium]|nr:hypothetical protein [bacterium]
MKKIFLYFSFGIVLVLWGCDSGHKSPVVTDDGTQTPDESDNTDDNTETDPDTNPDPDPAPDPDPIPDPDPTPDVVVDPILTPKINFFKADVTCIKPGESVSLSWETEDAAKIYLDGSAVEENGSKAISPGSSHTYKLTVKNGEHDEEKEIYVGVKKSYYEHETQSYSFDEGPIDNVTQSERGGLLILSEGRVYKGSYTKGFNDISPTGNEFTAAAFHPKSPKILYAASFGRVYRSNNNADSWSRVIPIRRNGLDLAITSLYVLPENTHKVVVGVDGGAFVYDDDADTLTLLPSINGEIVTQVASGENKIVYRTEGGLFQSSGSFGSFKSINSSSWNKIYQVKVNDDNEIIVGTNKGLYKKVGDASWQREGSYTGAVYDFSEDYPQLISDNGDPVAWYLSYFPFFGIEKPMHYYITNGNALMEYTSSALTTVLTVDMDRLLEMDTLVGVDGDRFQEITEVKKYEARCEAP